MDKGFCVVVGQRGPFALIMANAFDPDALAADHLIAKIRDLFADLVVHLGSVVS